MEDHEALALRYLTPPADGIWVWSQRQDAITWRSGETILFRTELAELLEPFVARGLCSLNGVVLVIAATRDSWMQKRRDMSRVYALEQIHLLPPDVKGTNSGRRTLLEMIFEDDRPEIMPAASHAVLRMLRDDTAWPFDNQGELSSPYNQAHQRRNFGWLSSKVRQLRAEEIKSRIKTGIETGIYPAEFELPARMLEADASGHWLELFERQPRLRGLISLSRDLAAVLTLPQANVQAESEPFGGVCDISNRGSFDRLLLSELAQDDVVLATRIALNEALFLRREQPRSRIQQRRMLLLDGGLRQWGIPRIYSLAVALALALNRPEPAGLSVFHADGTGLKSVNFENESGLTDALEFMSLELDVVGAIPAFGAEVAKAEELVERVVISSPEGTLIPEFMRSLSRAALFPLYLVTVERSGRCQLWAVNRAGRQLLKTVVLESRRLLKAGKSLEEPRQLDVETVLPAALKSYRFPLRYLVDTRKANSWKSKSGRAFFLTNDRLLVEWSNGSFAAEQLSDVVEPGNVEFAFEIGDLVFAILKSRAGRRLLRVDPGGQITEFSLSVNLWNDKFLVANEQLLAVSGSSILLLCLRTGSVLNDLRIDGYDRAFGRFFKKGDVWYVLTANGGEIRWEPLAIPSDQVLKIIDVDGVEGPIAVLKSGSIYFTGSQNLKPVVGLIQGNFRLESIELESDGKHLTARLSTDRGRLKFSRLKILGDEQIEVVGSSETQNAAIDYEKMYRHRPLRKHWRSAGVSPDGRFLLETSDGRELELTILDQDRFIFKKCNTSGLTNAQAESSVAYQPGCRIQFQRSLPPPGVGYKLRTALFPDGSRVFLDNRGFVHLQSSDRDLPEITLVAETAAVSGWNSKGQYFGDRFYFGTEATLSAAQFYNENIEPFIRQVLSAC